MRISDWSSDVCSSDLCSDHLIQRRVFDQLTDHRFTEFHRQRLVVIKPLASLAAQLRDALPSTARAVVRRALQQHAAIDRKSVVSGKRVSVRVVLGVRRIIQKKNNAKQE